MGSEEKLKKLAIVSGQLVEEKNYWTRKFAGPFEKSLFPPDYINQGNRVGELNKIKQTDIAGQYHSLLMTLRNNSDIRLLMILASAVTLLLHKYTGLKDITLAAPTLKQETEEDIQFINTILVLRQNLRPQMTFKELLLQLRQDLMASVEHQNYPMERLLYELDLPIPASDQPFPLFDVAIVLENIHTIDYLSPVNCGMCFSFYRGASTLDLEISYDSSLYKPSTIKRIITHLETQLSRVLQEIDRPVSQLDITAEPERARILEHLDRGRVDYPVDLNLAAIFQRQVDKTPDNIAVVLPAQTEDGTAVSLTYRQLDRRAGQLAAKLVQRGVGPETIVAILLESPLSMVVSILAVLKAGGAYMPIDMSFPADRVHFMLKDSATPVLLTTPDLAGEFGLLNAPAPLDNLNIMDIEFGPAGLDGAAVPSSIQIRPHHPAYVIYTSGTTGRPKGVIVEHRNVVRLFFHDQCFFDFNEDDVWTLFHSFCFDFSVWEMYGPLLHGGKLVLVDKLTARSPGRFLQLLKDEQITVLNQTPAAFYNLAKHALGEQVLLQLRYIIFGGEALQPSWLKAWQQSYPDTKLINMFGITETTVHVTFKELKKEDLDLGVSNIGVPIPTLGAYVMDDNLSPCPIGVIGELCVSGAGVARGYLNRPLLTAEKFPANPLRHDQKLYRSGDLGKLNEHLELEYLGRGDQQVKVRGYRIEPGEIERQLLNHPDVREAMVMLTPTAGSGASVDDGPCLCAYVVCNSPLSVSGMKEHLCQSLPNYMIPTFVVNLARMPLTANGKIDRKRLPLPEADVETGYSPPQTPYQKELTDIWAEVLGLDGETIGIDHNFFDLGGHSLKATAMALLVQKFMKVKLPMAEIFSTPTIRELSSYLENAVEEDYTELKSAEPREYYELSSAQQRFYTIYNMYPDNTAYNIPQLVPLPAQFDKHRVEAALKELINRHESLRTSFQIIDGQPVQIIHDTVDFSLGEIQAPPLESASSMNEIIGAFVTPFRLYQPPLIRAALIDMGSHPHVLIVDMHHIITDGVSNDILVEEFYALLRGISPPPVKYQYRDFSSWENSPARQRTIARQRDYWLRHLQGKPPRLELPLDNDSRSQGEIFSGGSIRFSIEGEKNAALKEMETTYNTSVFTILLSVYYILMAKMSGQEDIIVGTAAAGRTHADLMGIVGLFFNTLALRTRPQPDLTFLQYLDQVEEISREALENQDYPFDMLVQDLASRGALERRTARNPLFNTMFSLHNFGAQLERRSGPQESAPQYDPFAYQGNSSKFDLLLNVVQYPHVIHFVLDHSTALFKQSTAWEIGRNFSKILDQVLRNPGQIIRDIALSGELAQWAARHLLEKEENKVRDYWLEKLAGDPPKSGFPFDHQFAEAGQTLRLPQEWHFSFLPQLVEKLRKVSNQSDIRLYIILLTGVVALLEKYTGNRDILIGAPIERQEKESDFINTLLIFRIQLEDHMTFKELLLLVSKTMSSAVENVNYPFETLLYNMGVNYDPNADFPLFDVAVLLDNLHDPGYIENIHTNTGFHFERNNDGLTCVIRYNGAHYGEDTIRRIAGHLELLLESGLNALDAPLSTLQWLSDREIQQLIVDFNASPGEPIPAKDIPAGFDRQVEKSPDNPAVIADNGALTYSQLAQSSEALALQLRENGIGPGSVVALITGRDIEMIIGMTAILRASGAYLPINADYPTRRIQFMLEDSRAEAVLTIRPMVSQTCRDSVPEACPVLLIDSPPPHAAAGVVEWSSEPNRPAYVIYTSGSTGNPKGVIVEHRNVLNLVAGLHERIYRQYSSPLNVALVAPYIFDASVQQIFAALLLGHSLYIVPENARTHGGGLLDYLVQNRIDICDGTPSHLRLILESLDNGNYDSCQVEFPVKHLIIGGETLPLPVVKKFLSTFPAVKVSNVYGPTECCVDSTSYEINENNLTTYPFVPIGKPMSGESIYILDRNLRLKPIGAVGELCIGGSGVSRGYLNRPRLTGRKFVCPPFSQSRLYRTGDLARWLPDGNIEFLGRMDNQVQIRGFRIETGEIENQLLAHQDIDQALVMVRSWNADSRGEADGNAGDEDIYLCVYYLSKRNLEPADLKNELSQKLPDYMIPSFFVQLDSFSLTVNGKIDRKQLPPPQSDTCLRCVVPETPLQEKLLDIWSDILGMDKQLIGIDRDFFEIGGHSLKSTILISRMQRQFNVDVPIAEIFSNSTIRRLSDFIQQARKKQFIPIKPVEEQDFYVLSSAQKRLYILHQLDPAATGYNAPIAVELSGDVDMGRLEQAFAGLIQRHESLRTSFHLLEDQPVQRIHDADQISFHIERLEIPAEADIPDVLVRMVRPFDLSLPPLIRAGLITATGGRMILMVDIHHIISDGLSEEILLPEFLALYNGEQLTPLILQYKDFAHWQHSEAVKQDIKNSEIYWLEQFSNDIPVINLPTDFPRPRMQSFEGDGVRFHWDRSRMARLNQLIASEDVTLYMLLSAIFNTCLAKISGQEEIVVGSPVAGRRHADLRQIIGMFVNTLAMKHSPQGDKPFTQLLGEVKQKVLAGMEHQDYPFEDLVEKLSLRRDTNRNPLFDVMFTMQNFAVDPEALYRNENKGAHSAGSDSTNRTGDLKMSLYPASETLRTSKFDLTLSVLDVGDELTMRFEYCTRLFKRSSIQRFIQYFTQLTNEICGQPNARLSQFDLIGDEQKRHILYEFNQTGTPNRRAGTILELIERRAGEQPGSLALISDAQNMDYGEWYQRACRLAGQLQSWRVGPGVIVAVMVERSVEMMVGILSVLIAGGAYLPIDTGSPVSRAAYMLADSNAPLLLASPQTEAEDVVARLPGTAWLNLADQSLYSGPNPHPAAAPHDPAYVIYTSGSTGKPKGVMVAHYSLLNRLEWMQDKYPLTQDDVLLQKTPYTFDVSLWELFWWAMYGATLCLAAAGEEKDPKALLTRIRKHKVTAIHFVPSMLNVFLQYIDRFPSSGDDLPLKRVFSSGEALTPHHLEHFNRLIGSHLNATHRPRLINLYGPTEATVDVSYYDCPEQELPDILPIGKPIRNIRLYVLNKDRRLQPVGIPGELAIAGEGVAMGYLNNPGLTAENFVDNPFAGGVMYLTGDLTRWMEDGNIQFLGRFDHQVKIRGVRIELEEIRRTLLSHVSVTETFVMDHTDQSGEKYLCAYFVPTATPGNGDGPGQEVLRRHLAQSLPSVMLPAHFIRLDEMPRTTSGKIDINALPRVSEAAGTDHQPPQNQLQDTLARLWADILGTDLRAIGIHDNFLRSGGNSLKATLLVLAIHRTLGVKVPLAELFKTPTIKGLCRYVQTNRQAHVTGVYVTDFTSLESAEDREYYPLSAVQNRFFAIHQTDPVGTAYNIPQAIVFKEPVDVDKLRNTFLELIRRHESLRTSFHLIAGEPVQVIHPAVDFTLESWDLEEEVDLIKSIRDFIRPFDLSRAPLVRARLISPARHRILLVDMHHIITDGVSGSILKRDFFTLYSGGRLPSLPYQYKDYALWQTRDYWKVKMNRQEQFWLKFFEHQPVPLELPLDYKRGSNRSMDGASYQFELDENQAGELMKRIAESDATLFLYLFAIYNILLSKLCGREDIIVGTAAAARTHADLNGIIGLFFNTLAIRSFPRREKTFSQFLEEIKTLTLDAFENQDYPFDRLVDTLTEKSVIRPEINRNPLFDTMFALHNHDPYARPNLESRIVSALPGELNHQNGNDTAKFDLLFNAVEQDHKVKIYLDYSTALFAPETIENIARCYLDILDQVLADLGILVKNIKLSGDTEDATFDVKHSDYQDFQF